MKKHNDSIRLLFIHHSYTETEKIANTLKQHRINHRSHTVQQGSELLKALNHSIWDFVIYFTWSNITTIKSLVTIIQPLKTPTPLIAIDRVYHRKQDLQQKQEGANAVVGYDETDEFIRIIKQCIQEKSLRTQNKRLLQKNREYQTQFIQLFESSEDTIAYIQEGIIVKANQNFLNLFSFQEPTQIDALPILDLLLPSERAIFKVTLNATRQIQLSKTPTLTKNFTFLIKDKVEKHCHVNFSPSYYNTDSCTQIILKRIIPDTNHAAMITSNKPLLSDKTPIDPADLDHSNNNKIATKWMADIRTTLANNYFHLVFQPIVNLHANPEEKYEVLVRLHPPRSQAIDPSQFLLAAQHANLIYELDQWIIENAICYLEQQFPLGKSPCFFIKLSTQTLLKTTFLAWLDSIFKKYTVPTQAVVFEINENNIIHHFQATQQLIDSLNTFGCLTALEHIGSHSQALTHIHQLNVQFLKMTGALVSNITENRMDQITVKQIIDIAQNLDKYTIAGFVQDADSLAYLWQEGIHYIQGYYLQPPEPNLRYDFSGQA